MFLRNFVVALREFIFGVAKPVAKGKAVYIWWNTKVHSKPSVPMREILRNQKFFDYTIIGNAQLEQLTHQFDNQKMVELWQQIPWWIVKIDIGRLLYIYLYGGFYFDIDCRIKKNFLPMVHGQTVLFIEKEIPSTDTLGPREQKTADRKLRIANYALGSDNTKSTFIKKVIDEACRRIEILLSENGNHISALDVIWASGPDVITSVYHDNKDLHDNVLLLDNSYIKHKCTGSWRKSINAK